MKKKRNKWAILVVLFCMTLLLGCTNQGKEEAEEKTYDIPNVVGLSAKEAEEMMKEHHIECTVVEEDYSEEYKKGIIYEQSAVGESDDPQVNLKMSKGLGYRIADLSGKRYKDVKKELKRFKKKFYYTYSSDLAKGVVIESDFSGGLFHKGQKGSITLSNGKYSVNKVKGKNMEAAERQFPGAKFKIKYKFSQEERGKVLDFAVGESESKSGIPVKLVLSDGMAVKIPKVTGKSESKAIRILNKKGVQCRIRYVYEDIISDPTVSNGKVVAQSKKGVVNKSKPITLRVNKPAIVINEMNFHVDQYDFGNVNLTMDFANESDKAIGSIEFSVACYDRVGDKAYGRWNDNIMDMKYTGPLYPDGWDQRTAKDILYDSTVAAVKPLYAEIKFMDKTSQKITFEGRFWHNSEYAGDNYLPD